ncbi:uncharacterized protein [Physeter macrocephalus]|uniref:Uncharacterized protein isoform X2 n=1 Tax=Physeter macrocephalus TaxID=9755 RepID=A0A9W2WT03_PHYMC|nr:uncharacterized protein LOC114486617 isoform X2 [Physeter catodon]
MKYSQHYSLGLPENRKGYGADRIVMNISLRTSVPHSEHFTECLHYAQAVTKQDAAPAAWELIKSRRSHMQITLKQSPSVVSLHLCFSMYLKAVKSETGVSVWSHWAEDFHLQTSNRILMAASEAGRKGAEKKTLEEERYTGTQRRPREDGSRDWSYAVASRGMPADTRG